jgi:hypothetical protein
MRFFYGPNFSISIELWLRRTLVLLIMNRQTRIMNKTGVIDDDSCLTNKVQNVQVSPDTLHYRDK